MALKPTIYKLKISLSDMDRAYYDTLSLTVAQHPSETLERMTVRILAFCINAEEHLAFTKGLCEPDEPDIFSHSLDGQMTLWIDVGEPSFERIKKATRLADDVRVYSFNTKSDVWWGQESNKFEELKAQVFQFQWSDVQSVSELIERTMDCSVTISDNSAYIATESGEYEIAWKQLNLI